MTGLVSGVLLGILLVVKLPVLPDSALLWAAGPAAAFALQSPLVRSLAGLLIGILLAVSVAENRLKGLLPEPLVGIDLLVTGTVSDLPVNRDDMQRFRFVIEELKGNPWTGEVIVSLRKAAGVPQVAITPGDRLVMVVRLSRPGGVLNAGGFDYSGWLFMQGISANGYVKNIVSQQQGAVSHHLLRAKIRDAMRMTLGEGSFAGLMIALTIGETAQIDPSAWRQLTLTGTNHLLVISGLHVSLVVVGAYFLARRSGIAIGPAGFLSMVVGVVYGLIAGFGLPVQRALVMSGFGVLTLTLNRRFRLSAIFAIAMLVVLLIEPFALLNNGFWLSFGAVLALLFAFSGRIAKPDGGLTAWLRDSLWTQWVVTVAMLPMLLLLIHEVSLFGFAANIIAIPWVSLTVVPLLMAYLALLPLWEGFANAVLLLAQESLIICWQIIELVAAEAWMLTAIESNKAGVWVAFLGAMICLLPPGLAPRWPAVFCFLPLLSPAAVTDSLRVSFIDVGQGMSVLVQTRVHAVLYDAGPKFGERFDAGSNIVVPYLKYQGVQTLDKVVVSHRDNDHAGGVPAVIQQLNVLETIASEGCRQTSHWQADGVSFMLFSLAAHTTGTNNSSCLLLVTAGDQSLLLTGDIELAAEQQLAANQLPQITVMSVPHHGSRTSSSQGFINETMPEVVVVQAGFGNRFGHPHEEVLRRYRHRHVRVLDTRLTGGVRITIEAGGITRIDATRESDAAFWHLQRR